MLTANQRAGIPTSLFNSNVPKLLTTKCQYEQYLSLNYIHMKLIEREAVSCNAKIFAPSAISISNSQYKLEIGKDDMDFYCKISNKR